MDGFVGLRQMGGRGAWALLAVMAIVTLLGYEQYRWIVRVADAEETTNRERLLRRWRRRIERDAYLQV